MKLFEKIKGKLTGVPGPERQEIASRILEELEKRRAERMPFELQWRLNAAFLSGAQRCEINAPAGRLEHTLPAYDYEECGVYNRIAPLMDTRLSNLKSVGFTMAVRPATDQPEDYQKAQIATRLLRSAYTRGDFEHLTQTVLQWAELTGSAFVLSAWNPRAGRPLSVCDRGEPVREGELTYTLLSPYEVFPENLWRQNMEQQGSIILEQVMSAKEIRALYGIECEGREIESAVLQRPNTEGGHYLQGSVTMRDSERVITYMETPSAAHPEGLTVQLAAGQVVFCGQLPLGRLPVTVFRAKENAGQFFGKSVIEDLIPLQRAYNGCKNKMHDYISTLAANSLLVEEGSVDVEQMEENGTAPGAPVVYKRGYTPPVAMRHESMPGEIYAECEQLCRDMEYVAGVSQLMVVGSSTPGVTSGTAINSLRQIDSTRIALTAENMRAGALATAKLWLALYKRYCPGTLTLAIAGENDAGGVLTWCAEDVNSYDVYFETENELRFSPEERKRAFLEAYQMGLFNREDGSVPGELRARAAELMRIGDISALEDEAALQRKRAERENTVFSLTGRLEGPGELDDDEIHIAAHRRFALQMRFDAMEGAAGALIAHIRTHEERRERDAAIQPAEK